jgi:Transcriptional activator of glycolytic enzymes
MEWEVGLNGRPSVSSVETKWKNKWRIGSQNQKLYSRRHLIISMIHRYASKTGISNYEAASVIERKRILKKYSLRTLAEKWKTFEGTELN